MKKYYTVSAYYSASILVQVEADSPEEAKQKMGWMDLEPPLPTGGRIQFFKEHAVEIHDVTETK